MVILVFLFTHYRPPRLQWHRLQWHSGCSDSFWSIKGSPYTENAGYSDILLTVRLFCRPNTVTVSGELCTPMTYFSCWVNFLPYLTISMLEGDPSARRPDQSRSFSRLSELDPLSPSNAPASTKKPSRWKRQNGLSVIRMSIFHIC